MLNPRRLFIYLLIAASLIGIVCLAYAYFIEPNRLVVNESTLTIKNWNPAFDGLKIVMMGDIHGGSNNVTEEKLRQVVARTNEQNPDIVVMLGDFVSETYDDQPVSVVGLKMPMETIATNLAGIRAKYGVFAVLGNHDGWYNDGMVALELKRVGYRVLRNDDATNEKAGARIRLQGLTDHLPLPNVWLETDAEAKSIL